MLSQEITRDLINKSQNGDKDAKETLVKENMPLVTSIVKHFNFPNYEYEDLMQIGTIGLIKCINNFDLSRDNAFSTYAVLLITGEIKRYLRDDGKIKVSRSIKELSFKIEKVRREFEFKHNRPPKISEIAKILDKSIEEVSQAICSYNPVISLDAPIKGDEKGENYEIIGEDNEDEKVLILALKDAIKTLPDRDKEIVYLRFQKGLTQSDVAKILKITQVQVSRIEKKIIESLKLKLAG